MNKLLISIDLGEDTTKSTLILLNGNGKPNKRSIKPINICSKDGKGFPSLAYYKNETQSWIFGKEVNEAALDSFKYVVKIKQLLSFISYKKEGDNVHGNAYFKDKNFPIFYFPPKEDTTDPLESVKSQNSKLYKLAKQKYFAEILNENRVFTTPFTPQQVCEKFFAKYIKNIHASCGPIIEKYGIKNSDIHYIVVYPANISKTYIKELRRLVAVATNTEYVDVISSANSIGVAAKFYNIFGKKSVKNALSFTIGETETAVTKLHFIDEYEKITADSVDGHLPPMRIGGNAIDATLYNILNTKASQLSSATENVFESGTFYQQFLMMQELKKNKQMFVSEMYEMYLKNVGLPFRLVRDYEIKLNVKREELSDCLEDENGAYRRILSYVLEELRNPRNFDVDAIIFTGGPVETYHFASYIKEKLEIYNLNKPINIQNVDYYDFNNFEDLNGNQINPSFMCACGAAIFLTGLYEFKLITTCSYGTWAIWHNNDDHKKVYREIIPKGTEIPAEGLVQKTSFVLGTIKEPCIKDNEYFSVSNYDPNSKLFIGEKNSPERMLAKINNGLNELIDECIIKFSQLPPYEFSYFEGIEVDTEGRGMPFVENNIMKNLADCREYANTQVTIADIDGNPIEIGVD